MCFFLTPKEASSLVIDTIIHSGTYISKVLVPSATGRLYTCMQHASPISLQMESNSIHLALACTRDDSVCPYVAFSLAELVVE